MKKILNPQTALLGVGVVQPGTALDLLEFMRGTFPEAGTLPPLGDLQKFLDEQVAAGRVILVQSRRRRLYSLTEQGSLYLSQTMRKLRDKIRVYLLRDAHRRKFVGSRTKVKSGLVGVSPTVDSRVGIKERVANKLGPRAILRNDQVYWPRAFRQFQSEAGPKDLVRDAFLELISFKSIAELRRARSGEQSGDFDFVGIGLCLSLSPLLLTRMASNPSKYYREFPLPKKSGGHRTIRSPRIFLKVVQWFLAEYVLTALPVSAAVHSFRPDRSIVTNATKHENSAYVANIDIEDFFGSITSKRVRTLLKMEGFRPDEVAAISRLVTYEDSLPQGAPTSPLISNAILYEFDVSLEGFARARGITYTRYADDMTLSGPGMKAIQLCIGKAEQLLKRHGLKINDKKTRIASKGGQQRVTGVVVNSEAVPARVSRRKIRAAFHNASRSPGAFAGRTSELGGYIGYLNQFPKLQESSALTEYRRILQLVRMISRARHLQDTLPATTA